MKKDSALVLFGSKVRKTREAQALSQEALAAEADIDRTYIGGVERGERNLSLKNILKIAKALKVHPSTLFTGYTQ